jgi:hypothetical protein
MSMLTNKTTKNFGIFMDYLLEYMKDAKWIGWVDQLFFSLDGLLFIN